MKKSLLASVATTSLLALGIYVGSFFTISTHDNKLTLETLIDKVGAAAEIRAAEGRYYHQKIKFTADVNNTGSVYGPPGGILYTHSLPDDIIESWADSVTGNYMIANRVAYEDTNEYGKIYAVDLTKNNQRKVYLPEAGMNGVDQPVRPHNVFFDITKSLGSHLKSVLSGEEKIAILKSIFPADLLNITEVTYLGQSNINGRTAEGISFNVFDKNGPGDKNILVNFYFDAQTFEIFAGKIVQNGSISEIQYLANDYSNVAPTVQIDGTILTL